MPEDMMSMMPKNLPEDKKDQWKKHYSEAMSEEGMTPEKAASMATEKCMKQNRRRSNGMKLNLAGLIGYLQGKGMKVHVNEDTASEEDAFEILEEPAAPSEIEEESLSDETLSAEELKALKGFATVLAKNGKLIEAIEKGTLDTALETVPAAAELVKNAQARDKSEKDQLIATIKANSSNVYSDEELNALSNPVLVKLNAQMNVNYMGMGGAIIQNAEQPLGLPTSLLAQTQEAGNGS